MGMFPTITHSSDTLDLCSMDSLSLDEHLEKTQHADSPVTVNIKAVEDKTFRNSINNSVAPEPV